MTNLQAELDTGPRYTAKTVKGKRLTSNPHPFLQALSSDGRGRYKRYVGSPLRYAGGKSLAVGFIIEHFPANIRKLVSPFMGGGSVEIAAAKEMGLSVVGYDVFDILAGYWQVQIQSPKELAKVLDGWHPTKDQYDEVKTRLKAHWKGERAIKNNLQLAAHYWFNHNLSYGPGFLGWMSKIYEQPERYARLVNRVRSFRCADLSVRSASFENAIPRHNQEFLYCDPPYYLEGDSKMFRGIYPQRNFPVHHDGFNHQHLRDLLHKHQGGFILSYNDCEAVRQWYADFDIVEVEWQYTLGQGETRIGKNRIENGSHHHVKPSHELLIIKEK